MCAVWQRNRSARSTRTMTRRRGDRKIWDRKILDRPGVLQNGIRAFVIFLSAVFLLSKSNYLFRVGDGKMFDRIGIWRNGIEASIIFLSSIFLPIKLHVPASENVPVAVETEHYMPVILRMDPCNAAWQYGVRHIRIGCVPVVEIKLSIQSGRRKNV